jgi:hypothetical protein
MSLRHVIASAGVLLGLVVPAAGAAGAASGPALLASPMQSATGPIVAPQKPILLQLRLNPSEIRVGSPAISRSAPGLTTITFLLGEPATVSFTVTRAKAVAGGFTVHGRPGGNAVPFNGTFRGGTRLAPGTYTLTATPIDSAHVAGVPRTVRLTVLGGQRKKSHA